MRAAHSIGAVALTLLLTAPAQAQDADGRFQLMPVEGGALRLDTATGAMDLCRGEGEGWRCSRVVAPPVLDAASPDPAPPVRSLRRTGSDAEAELARLRAALAEIGAIARAATASSGPTVTSSERTRREIDEAIEVTDYTLRRFLDLYRTFQEVGPERAPPKAD